MQRRGFLKGLLTGIAAVVGGARLAQAADVVPMKCVPLRVPDGGVVWANDSRYVYSIPEGVTSVHVSCYGGGGGGSAGGNGEIMILMDETIRVRPGESIAVTIGA